MGVSAGAFVSSSPSLGTASSPAAAFLMAKKQHLPEKVCVTCNRPFTWRKKWERCWDEVTTCSKSCNRKRRGDRRNNSSVTKQEMHTGRVESVDNSDFFKCPTSGRANILIKESQSELHKESDEISDQ